VVTGSLTRWGQCVLGFIAILAILLIIFELAPGPGLPFIDSNRADLLPGLLIGLGILLALLTFARDTHNQATERQRRSDEIAFEAARDAFQQAALQIGDRNNDRIIWIGAARLLLKAQELAEGIKTRSIREAVRLEVANAKLRLQRALSVTDPETGKVQCLPPAFFTGLDSWDRVGEGEQELKRAFAETDSGFVAGWMGLNKMIEEPQLRQLTPASVVAVFDFLLSATWQDDDPLKKVELWDTSPYDAHPGIDQGARHYVYAKKRYFVIEGKVQEIAPEDDQVPFGDDS
jgi:hypothetical protein